MNDVMGWGTIVMVLAIPVVVAGVGLSTRLRQKSPQHGQTSSGGLLGFDELFHPSAHDARLVWEAEQEIPIPAPTPDRGPGVIEAGGRIVIDVPRPQAPTPPAPESDRDY